MTICILRGKTLLQVSANMANYQLQINVGAISNAFASALQQVADATVGASLPNVSTNAVVLPSTFSPQPGSMPQPDTRSSDIVT